MKYPITETFFLALGWVAISPFVIKEYVVRGFKWTIKKIKKK